MTAPYPSARSIRHALCVLERLPLAALPDLVEGLIDRLDAAGADSDLEPETDACNAGECGGLKHPGDGNAGDALDAEPDNDDQGDGDDEPCFLDTYRLPTTGIADKAH